TDGDEAAPQRQRNDSNGDTSVAKGQEEATFVAESNNGSAGANETSVANTNNGLGVDVAKTNRGLSQKDASMVEPTNDGQPTDVALANTTYNQDSFTTKTTTTSVSRARQK